MLYLGTTPLSGMIKTKLFTSSGTFVVPSDVYAVWIDGSGGGGGGGGGNATPGGGGGGGGGALAVRNFLLQVVPAESLTITIGAAGTGGSAGADGSVGGVSSIIGTYCAAYLTYGAMGKAGANPNGGAGGAVPFASTGPAGGAGVGANATVMTTMSYAGIDTLCRSTSGAAGGALSYAGGANYRQNGNQSWLSGSAGNASGGGGGAGGFNPFGSGGAGGANGAAGSVATGYGGGGGGGSGNSAGGDGSSGFVCIYYISKYTVA